MTKVEAIEIASAVKGLMTRLTDEQMREMRDRILPPLEFDPTMIAAREYAACKQDFNLAEFRSFIRNYEADTAYERTQKYLVEERARAAEVTREWEQSDHEFERLAGGMTEAELTELAKQSIASLGWSDAFKSRMLERGPKHSRVLRQCICEYVSTNPKAVKEVCDAK